MADSTDGTAKTNYADEVAGFSNLADILVVTPTDDIVDRIRAFNDLEMTAVLHLNEIFFELVDSESASGANYDLRSDFRDRWKQFSARHQSVLTEDHIGALYIGEEPTWNGIPFEELNEVAVLLQEQFPAIPTMIIEAYPVLAKLQVPESVDWIGFDRYFIKEVNNDSDFQKDFRTLKSKIPNSQQRIILIMDSHHIDWAHGDFEKIAVEQMGEVADNYYQLAQSDTTVIGILGHFWPSGFDLLGSIGARGDARGGA